MNIEQKLEEYNQLFGGGKYKESGVLLSALKAEADFKTCSAVEQATVSQERARVLITLGNYDEAKLELDFASSVFLEMNGRNSFEYTECLILNGKISYEAHNLDDAEKVLREVLMIRRELFKEPDERIADVINNLGEVLWKGGDSYKALELWDEALAMRKQVHGEENMNYAETLCNRSLLMMRLGRHDEAEDGFRRALKIRELVLPPGHTDIANSLANLCHLLLMRRKYDGVEEMLKRSVAIMQNAAGDSPVTAIVVNNLGGYYLQTGNLNEAAKYFEQALAIKEKVLGKDNKALATNISNLSRVYTQLKRHDEAAVYSARADALMKEKIESSNSKDIETMILRADQLLQTKNKSEAQEVLNEALRVAKEDYGHDSLKVAQVLKYLATSQLRTNPDKASSLLIEVLRIQKKHLGKKHAENAEPLGWLADCLLMQGSQDTAELLRLQARAIQFKNGAEDPVILELKTLLNKSKAQFGPDSKETLAQMKMLSTMLQHNGRRKEANDLFAEYRAGLKKSAGAESLEYARAISNHAVTLLPLGVLAALKPEQKDSCDKADLHLASDLLEEAIAIATKLNEMDDVTDWTIFRANVLCLLGKASEAESLARFALAASEQKHGSDHWQLKKPITTLRMVMDFAKADGGLSVEDEDAKSAEINALDQRLASIREPSAREQQENVQKLLAKAFSGMEALFGSLVNLTQAAEEEQS